MSTPNDQAAANQATVLAFLELALVERKPAEAAERYMSDNYIQHNPTLPNGREHFAGMAAGLFEQFPGFSMDIRRVVASGDLVALHSLVSMSAEDPGMAVADFFLVEDGRIVEHWDVIQPVPEETASGNPIV